MSAPAPAPGTVPPPPRRRRRWPIAGLVLLAVIIGVAAWFVVRGTWGSAERRLPPPGGDAVSYVYSPPGGGTHVRAAKYLPYDRDAVWAAVTDYEHYGDFLPYLRNVKTERNEGGWHMTGEAKSLTGGYWPFDIDMRENKSPDGWVVSWDKPGGEVRVNRGRWAVTGEPGKPTLLELDLETEVDGTPTFLIRNYYLHRLRKVVQAVEERLKSQGAAPVPAP